MSTETVVTAREEAAEDAADLWAHRQGYAMTGTEWGAFEQGHLAGSAWARDRLAEPEPTDAEIQAVMKVARTHYSMPLGVGPSFARAVIAAVRAAR